MKLSDIQVRVMVILCEGQICLDDENVLSLDDADGNTYKIHRNTFNALLDKRMIEFKLEPALGIEMYGLTKVGEEYLLKNHIEAIDRFYI